MRFELQLELKKPEFPVDYRRHIMSFIKNALSESGHGLLEKYYYGTQEKDFCFNLRLDKPEYKKECIQLRSKYLHILFSADDRNKTGFFLMNSLAGMKNKRFPLPDDNAMILKNIRQKKTAKIESNNVLFKTSVGSGICVREHNPETNKDKYYVQGEKGFEQQFSFLIKNQLLRAGFSEVQADNVQVKGMFNKKVVAKHYDTFLDLNIGMCQMKGDPEVLQYLYNVGLCSRRSAGFSMVDLVAQGLI